MPTYLSTYHPNYLHCLLTYIPTYLLIFLLTYLLSYNPKLYTIFLPIVLYHTISSPKSIKRFFISLSQYTRTVVKGGVQLVLNE